MNVELNTAVVIDDWQAVVNRTVANYSGPGYARL